MNFRDKLEKLRDAASLSNDELGEYWTSLCEAYDSSLRFGCSDSLEKALENEISLEYDRLEEEFEIIETEHTITHVVRTLEMKCP